MALQRQQRATEKPFTLRELSREDLARLDDKRANIATPQKLRESHHRIAQLLAMGLTHFEVSRRVGYSLNRVSMLAAAPAMQDLIVHYRNRITEKFEAEAEEYVSLLTQNMVAAERHIRDRIDALDESDELLSVKDAIAIGRDAADRLGYGKKKDLNVNLDFAANLEAMLRRSGKTIEGRVLRAQPAASTPETGEGSAPAGVPPPLTRRIA